MRIMGLKFPRIPRRYGASRTHGAAPRRSPPAASVLHSGGEIGVQLPFAGGKLAV